MLKPCAFERHMKEADSSFLNLDHVSRLLAAKKSGAAQRLGKWG